MTKFDLNKVYNLEDMLQGNVNRMCVTHDMKELNDMRAWAENRIAEIFEMNYARINEEIENLPLNVEEEDIEIPNGATNGDMIKTMFPNIEIEGIGGEIKCIATQNGTSYFALDWWNAPYKG